MKIQFFHILFESYADDTICHCSTESGAKIMKEVIFRRFEECYLTLKRDKKKVVCCKNWQFKNSHEW